MVRQTPAIWRLWFACRVSPLNVRLARNTAMKVPVCAAGKVRVPCNGKVGTRVTAALGEMISRLTVVPGGLSRQSHVRAQAGFAAVGLTATNEPICGWTTSSPAVRVNLVLKPSRRPLAVSLLRIARQAFRGPVGQAGVSPNRNSIWDCVLSFCCPQCKMPLMLGPVRG